MLVEYTDVKISPDDLAHTFERFCKVDRSSHWAGGTGLGLVSIKLTVENHNGEEWADSQEGQRSTCWSSLLTVQQDPTD